MSQNKWFYLCLLSFIWGSSYILIKYGLIGLTPLQLGSVRIIISCFFLLIIGYNSISNLTYYEWKWLIITGFIGTFFPSFLFAFAQKYIDSALTAIMNSLTPIFTLIIGLLFFSSKIYLRQYIGVALGFIGTSSLIWNGISSGVNNDFFYSFLIICASICYATNIHFLKIKLSNVKPVAIALGNFIAIFPPAFIYLFVSDFFSLENLKNPELINSLGYIVLLAFFATAIAKIIFLKLVKISTPIFVSSVTYLIPIVAFFWGVLDGESIGILEIISAVMILIGVFLANKPKEQNK